MKSITLRDLPEELANRITERAAKTGSSLNKTVIEILSETGPAKNRRVYHDLDYLAGSWSEQESSELRPLLETQRVIEPELWK